MQMQSFVPRALAFALGVAVFAFSGAASADPPARIARLGYMAGAVSFSPAGENDWVQAALNRPLSNGDRLWVDAGARAEIQDGGAMLRLNANTSVSVLNLDDRITQLQLTQGVLNVRVRRLAPDQVLEVDTPNLALMLRQSGDYRIAVEPDGSVTDVIVRQGQAEVVGEGAGYLVDARQWYRFRGNDLRDNQFLDAPRPDEFDRWAGERDRAFDNSVSARYVSRDVVGYQDLDANGSWRVDANYGNVWVPSRVAADWVPYRDGHWAWIDPWGWTWVDNAPWGFAVSHYGRWANLGNTWCWVPGPVRSTAYYAPALVVFVGGDNFRLTLSSGNVGGVAWFPLAPREVYRPSYPASRTYFENVNRSNTVINTTVINNTYNTYNTTNVTNVTNVVYANRQVPGAVVAVPRNTFVRSQPVSSAVVQVSREQVGSAPLAAAPRVAPTEQSVHGAGAPRERPLGRVFERPVVAVTAPPAPHLGFAAQKQQLTLNPGKPLDDSARKELKPAAAAAQTPVIRVLGPAPGTPSMAAPAPPLPPASRQVAPPTPVLALPVKPGLPTMPSQEQRGNADQRGGGQQRAPVVAPPAPALPLAPQGLTQPRPASPPPVTPPAPALAGKQLEPRPPGAVPRPPASSVPAPSQAQPWAEPRGQAPQRGNDQQRLQLVAPAVPAPPLRVPESRPVPPAVAPAAAAAAQVPPQRPVPAPQPQVAPPVPAPAARQMEPHPPVAVPRPALPAAQSVPQAERQGQKPAAAASKPNDAEMGREGPKR